VSSELRRVLAALLEQEGLRLVIDADGLNNLAKMKNWTLRLRAELILTPHPGEVKRLWEGLFREQMPGERQEQAGRLSERTKSIVVLKGAGTVVTDGQKFYVNETGNPGMATAGSGDVLTGVIAALAGQGLDNFNAAVLGVYVHGLAGDIAAEKFGQVSLMTISSAESRVLRTPRAARADGCRPSHIITVRQRVANAAKKIFHWPVFVRFLLGFSGAGCR
jgi:NAD(P)H-hydrate epimerase